MATAHCNRNRRSRLHNISLIRINTIMKLSNQDVLNILDMLKEWSEHPNLGPKEMDKADTGLDYERYIELKARLEAFRINQLS